MRRLATGCSFFLFLLLTLLGCQKGPTIAPLSDGSVVLAFGDSLTYGTGASREEAYPAVLAEMLGVSVVNAGVPGELSGTGAERLPALLDEVAPDLVILCHGGNDFLQRRGGDGVRKNLRQMIALSRAAGAEVVLIAVPKLGLLLDADPLYREVADELQVPLEEDVLSDVLAERDLKSDTIHPNARGYAEMAKALQRLIEKAQR
ncbi:MAG: arylesterase [Desulfuromonas sp.]|nr:MAG: arylesterase [Desulfuromonas sp.]